VLNGVKTRSKVTEVVTDLVTEKIGFIVLKKTHPNSCQDAPTLILEACNADQNATQ
jgi:hypothetical protein